MGRSDSAARRPFRFILNNSRATAANVYLLLYPKPDLAAAMKSDMGLGRRIWRVLNAIDADELLGEGRVYGGGLHKLEPAELARVDATAIAEMIPARIGRQPSQNMLFAAVQSEPEARRLP